MARLRRIPSGRSGVTDTFPEGRGFESTWSFLVRSLLSEALQQNPHQERKKKARCAAGLALRVETPNSTLKGSACS